MDPSLSVQLAHLSGASAALVGTGMEAGFPWMQVYRL